MDTSRFTEQKATLIGQSIPHSPVLEKGSNSDYKNAYVSKIKEWREATRQQAKIAYRTSPEFEHVKEYIRYLENDPWDKRRPRHRSNYRNNKVGLARRDRLARLGDSRPIMDVNSSVEAFEDCAYAIGGVIRAEWIRQNLSDEFNMGYDIACLNGTAFYKVGAAKNKLTLTAFGPDQVFPIQPSLKSIQTSAAILHENWNTVNQIKLIFPFSSQGIESETKSLNTFNDKFNRPDTMDRTTWDMLSPQMKRQVGVTTDFGMDNSKEYYGIAKLEQYYVEDYSRNESSRTIVMKDPYLGVDSHNYWYEVKPGERLYPRKRLICFVGNRLLYDGPSPYWHGLYPFVCLRVNPTPWSFYGYSIYRDLIPMQKLLNEIPAGISDLIAKALNPTLVARGNAVSQAILSNFRSDLPGGKLVLNGMADPKDSILWAPAPEIPNYVAQMLQGVLNPEFDKLAGTVDMMALGNKNQVPGGETMDVMRDSLQTQLRREERFLETALNDMGQQAVSNVIQFYTVKQRMKILGADGITDQDFLFDPGVIYSGKKEFARNTGNSPEYFWQMFSLKVTPGSLHSGAYEKSKIEAVTLFKHGLIGIRETLRRLRYSPSDIERILSEKIEEEQIIASLTGGGAGGGPQGGSGAPASPGGEPNRTPRPQAEKEKGIQGGF